MIIHCLHIAAFAYTLHLHAHYFCELFLRIKTYVIHIQLFSINGCFFIQIGGRNVCLTTIPIVIFLMFSIAYEMVLF